MRSEREQVAVPWPAIGGLSGAALMMLGSFLSWFEISTALQTTTTSGLDSGDGKIVVILAFAIATISGAVLAGIPLPALVGKLAAVLGLIVPPGDVGALSKALEELASDPDLRRRLGSSAAERAATFRTWEEVAALFFSTVRSAL